MQNTVLFHFKQIHNFIILDFKMFRYHYFGHFLLYTHPRGKLILIAQSIFEVGASKFFSKSHTLENLLSPLDTLCVRAGGTTECVHMFVNIGTRPV